MVIKDIMTKNPRTAHVGMSLLDVSKLMVECDCGAIPVVSSEGKPVGIITDRDIVCRTVAKGLNPIDYTVDNCMTKSLVTVGLHDSLEYCLNLMEDNQIRRMIVVDEKGLCCGIVSQADIALNLSNEKTAEMVEKVSQPVG